MSGDLLVARAERLTLWAVQSHGAAAGKMQDALGRLRQTQVALTEFTKAHPHDLTGQRRLWLAVRLAVREVTLANPDINFNQIIFATRTGPDSGNITNGSLRDAYGPGGEIYVKSGLSPSDPAKRLIAGRLGIGHLRGMDLHWDADRLIFSYLK
jgi:hypothetical protein